MNALLQRDADLLADCDQLVAIDEAGRSALAGPMAGAGVQPVTDFKAVHSDLVFFANKY